VTIAAGFCYDGGVLLCADSLGETGESRSIINKIGCRSGPWGTIAGATAGNVDYAAAAFNGLLDEIASGECDCISDVRSVLHDFYSEHVFSHPLYQSYPDNLKYSLLLAIRFAGAARTSLHVTNEAIMREVNTFRCEGLGRDVGHSVLMPLCRSGLSEEQTALLAAYMLAKVKRSVPGCGGASNFINVSHSGPAEVKIYDPHVFHIENVCGWFDQCASQFLLDHMNGSMAEFESRLVQLNGQARHLRVLWDDLIVKAQSSPPSPTTDSLLPPP
jgi:hypothetical protein